MKIKCIKSLKMEGDKKNCITKGKVYEAEQDGDYFFIKNNFGEDHMWTGFDVDDPTCSTEEYFILEGEALPCPFCGVVPEIVEQNIIVEGKKQRAKMARHDVSLCVLDRYTFHLDKWNTRS